MDDGRPLFVQIAEQIESSILDGSLTEGERAPSTNELAAFHRINPATAAKGINLLVDRGILTKRRGLGMFVTPGARELLHAERRQRFTDDVVAAMVAEGRAIGLDVEEIVDMVRAAYPRSAAYSHTDTYPHSDTLPRTAAHPSPPKERAQ
ncbi:GntR family transcriptional regulator [Dietzia massiliensis]|uniref:GntR family transcriptional regulator n=1 Tax=Dietzia massiliensis TaxID=2697499 RepID=UPI001BCBC72B|nr:GntR family transcriptional regulator [Dietzia massiliensis]MBS7547952.1 GntR family transcriptional regulator [Dietzia massiliensis]